MSDKNRDPPSKNRSQWFSFIIYPDSCPNWRQLLEELKVPCAVSPLHDKDKKEDGDLKKPHFHALFNFSSLKSISQVATLIKPFSNSYCEIVMSPKASHDYFSHKNNPEKAQYKESDILYVNGFKPPIDRDELHNISVSKLVSIIRDNEFKSFSQLLFSVADDSFVCELVLKYSYALNLVINEMKGN